MPSLYPNYSLSSNVANATRRNVSIGSVAIAQSESPNLLKKKKKKDWQLLVTEFFLKVLWCELRQPSSYL